MENPYVEGRVVELNDETKLQGEIACAGGVCEI